MFTRSSANAACGGLKPPPDRRLRRAKPSSPTEHRFLKVLPIYIQTPIPRSWRTSGGPCTTPLRCSPHRSFQGADTHQRDSAREGSEDLVRDGRLRVGLLLVRREVWSACPYPRPTEVAYPCRCFMPCRALSYQHQRRIQMNRPCFSGGVLGFATTLSLSGSAPGAELLLTRCLRRGDGLATLWWSMPMLLPCGQLPVVVCSRVPVLRPIAML